MDYLMRSHQSLVIRYAEHVVHTWEDKNPLFHNTLIHFYKEKALSDDTSASHARKKLAEFLQKSRNYTPDTILMNFPTDTLLEERSVILGRLGRHEQALGIFVRVFGDIDRAVTYCNSVYDRNVPGTQDVCVYLVNLIILTRILLGVR